jgi:hypothetical protein
VRRFFGGTLSHVPCLPRQLELGAGLLLARNARDDLIAAEINAWT